MKADTAPAGEEPPGARVRQEMDVMTHMNLAGIAFFLLQIASQEIEALENRLSGTREGRKQ